MALNDTRQGFALLVESALKDFFTTNFGTEITSRRETADGKPIRSTDGAKLDDFPEAVLVEYWEGGGLAQTAATFQAERDGYTYRFTHGTDQPLMQVVVAYSMRANGMGQIEYII